MGIFAGQGLTSFGRIALGAGLAASLLAGCAGKERIVTVSTPCVKADQIPPEVPPAGPLPENAIAAADILGALVLQLRSTDRELRAILKGCQA